MFNLKKEYISQKLDKVNPVYRNHEVKVPSSSFRPFLSLPGALLLNRL